MNSSFLPFYLLGLRCKLFRPCLLDLSCKCAKRAPSGGQVPHDAWPYRSCKICPRLNAINVFGELKLIILLAVLARTITILLARKNLCRAHDTDSFYTPATALSKVFTLKLWFYLENRDFRPAKTLIICRSFSFCSRVLQLHRRWQTGEGAMPAYCCHHLSVQRCDVMLWYYCDRL